MEMTRGVADTSCSCFFNALQVAVFSVDRELLSEISRAAKQGLSLDRFKGQSTLKLIQSIKTVPSAFPTKMNTCGRICTSTLMFFAFERVNRNSHIVSLASISCRRSSIREVRHRLQPRPRIHHHFPRQAGLRELEGKGHAGHSRSRRLLPHARRDPPALPVRSLGPISHRGEPRQRYHRRFQLQSHFRRDQVHWQRVPRPKSELHLLLVS